MRKFSTLLLLLFTSLLFVACSDNNDGPTLPEITITTSEFTVGAEAGSEAEATFDINVSWDTTISYDGNTKDWLTVAPTSGDAGEGLIITMKTTTANPAQVTRTAYVAINYGAATPHKLTVTQQGLEGPTITITTSEFTVGAEADSEAIATFGINASWDTTISYDGDTKDWLTVAPTSGDAGEGLIITMKTTTANPAQVTRTAYVAINYGAATPHKLTVTQTISSSLDITSRFDPKFAAKLQEKGYIPNAKKITMMDVVGITKIDVSGHFNIIGNLTSLAGIEYLQSLTSLKCIYNQFTTFDISKNTALKILNCNSNQITSLDVSGNTALTEMDCTYNQLPTLDVSKNTALTKLHCHSNRLTALDVSKNTALTELHCNSNRLTALDVSENTALKILNFGSNKLTAFDISKNMALTTLWCAGNELTAIDVSKNTALIHLYCDVNQITTLDVSKNTALIHLYCYHNKLTTLDVSKNTALTRFYCYANQFTTLDVSKNTALSALWCFDNQFTTLDVSANTALTEFRCDKNPGDGTTFPVKAWFDNSGIPPMDFTKGNWEYNGNTITINYYK